MTRTVFPFAARDMSALARSLARELEAGDHRPGHVQLLNMLARAVGYRNFQHFRAQHAAGERLDEAQPPAQPVDHLQVERVARYFDADGRLARWPAKTSLQRLCLWVLWSKIPPGQVMTETQISTLLKDLHGFGDHALLRRDLVDTRLAARTSDCREYQRIEQRPPAEALALIRHLGTRARYRARR